MIPMNHEERNPMKHIKHFLTQALMLCVGVFCVFVFVALLAQLISLSFYVVMLAVAVGALAYIYCWSPNDSNPDRDL